MQTTETTLFDQILTLIDFAETIDDDVKTTWKNEIEAHGLSPEMQENVMKLFEAEANRLGTEIDETQSMMSTIATIAERVDSENQSNYAQLAREVEEDTTIIENEFADICRNEVKEAEGIEMNAKAQSDQSEADAIRAMLAQKPADEEPQA
jgi:dissimilatory sulfite reductase (desulfoviridin) alpha/beta subunit